MSDRITIVAEPRTITGKKVNKLRREGLVPGVIYGQGEPIHVQMEQNALRRALRVVSTTSLANVDVSGKQHTVLVREIQQHLTRGNVMHVDFLKVDMLSTLTSEAELTLVGRLPSEIASLGTAVLVLRSVEIECLPDALVSEIEVDLSIIKTPDDAIYVSNLKLPAGVTILTDPEALVAHFEYTAAAEEEEKEEEAFIPVADAVEVISRGKKEEEFE